MLVYPAYLDDKEGHVAPDLNLKAQIPPTLIVHSEDDKTHVVGSKVYDAALTAAKVAHEFKLYPTGGHGYGLHCNGDAKRLAGRHAEVADGRWCRLWEVSFRALPKRCANFGNESGGG